MLREEGGGGVEEGSRAICVETSGVKYKYIYIYIRCCTVCNVTAQNVTLGICKQTVHT